MENNNVTIIENNGYDVSKYNAVKHGVLSKEAVLDWESQDDYNSLVAAFEEEYLPQGITETYLVTELAQIIWRKRRLRMAEKTIVKSNLSFSNSSAIKKAIYGHSEIKSIKNNVEDAFRCTEKQAQEQIEELQGIIAKFQALLDKDYNYEEYLQNIDDDLKKNWEDWLEDKSYYKADAESFKRFIQKNCIDYYQEQLNPLLVRDAIKYEAICEAVEPTKKYDNLSRYESHLDRKFEKTLGMIVKLQELRGQGASEPSKTV
jgi:hypothetical protein